MKPTNEQIKAMEKTGVTMTLRDTYTEIGYYTNHSGEEILEIPFDDDLKQYLTDYYERYDVSEETYLWLDNTGHGKNGAPYDMADVLADKQEWESKLKDLAMVA